MELTLDQALQKGVEAHKAGQVQEADRLYTAILKALPKHPDANHNMGVLAVGVDKVQEALPFFKAALEANPSTAQFWLSYIDALVKLDRLTDAKAVFDQAKVSGAKGEAFNKLEQRLEGVEPSEITVSQNQDPPQDQLQPVIDLYSQRQLQEALSETMQLLKQFPKSVTLYNIQGATNAGLGRLDQAIDSYNKALAIKPDNAEAYYNMGNSLNKLGKLAEAIGDYNKALAIKPDYAEAYYNMGIALKQQGKLGEAIVAYNKALASKPDHAEAYSNMGNALQDQGKLEEAIEAYNNALALKPDYAEAYYNMGNALQKQGKLEAAVDAYNRSLALKPNSAEAYNNIGLALKEQGKLGEAIVAYNKALASKPDHAEAHNNMGNVLQEQGKLEEAIEAYNKALAIKPDYAEVYNNMGNSLKKQGKLAEAIGGYNKALAIKPNYAEAYNHMGLALKEQGKLAEAIEAYNKGLAIKPDYAEASYNLALVLHQTGQYEEASSFFRKNASSVSQTWLLKSLYELDNQSDFCDQLDYLINQGQNNSVIGSYISRSKIRYGINRENPFCNHPLKYASKVDLTQKYDFKDVFIKGALKILSEGIVQNKTQDLLTKGSQTAGNVFGQMGPYRNRIQDIIRMEIENYRLRFKGSSEGLISSWPDNYKLDGWIVKMKNGGAIKPHMHEQGWISGSVYINIPPKLKEDSGNLVVCVDSGTDKTDQGEQFKSIDVVTGSLCLFPSSLYHYTIPFEADEDRIVMAFDVVPE